MLIYMTPEGNLFMYYYDEHMRVRVYVHTFDNSTVREATTLYNFESLRDVESFANIFYRDWVQEYCTEWEVTEPVPVYLSRLGPWYYNPARKS